MRQLPNPKIYELEFKYMPWGKLISKVLAICKQRISKNARVLDLMCGPGFLLNQIHKTRKDLHLTGVDIDKRYILYGQKNYKNISFTRANSLTWESNHKYDVVLCTAGLHHVPYLQQERFLKKIASLLDTNGFCIIADPYVGKFTNEKERRFAAAELGIEYLRAVLQNNSPDEMVTACMDIMHNDILPHGEYKNYVGRIKKIASKYFKIESINKTWPNYKSEFGDYYFVLKAK